MTLLYHRGSDHEILRAFKTKFVKPDSQYLLIYWAVFTWFWFQVELTLRQICGSTNSAQKLAGMSLLSMLRNRVDRVDLNLTDINENRRRRKLILDQQSHSPRLARGKNAVFL